LKKLKTKIGDNPDPLDDSNLFYDNKQKQTINLVHKLSLNFSYLILNRP